MAERKNTTTNIHHLHADAQDAATDVLTADETRQKQNAEAAENGKPQIDLYDTSVYFNRELSWLDFNWRVLNEALDPQTPLLERIKFLAITSSNLDEFFMIRVAGLRQQLDLGIPDVPADGATPDETLDKIAASVKSMMKKMSDAFRNEIHPGLQKNGITLHEFGEMDDKAKRWCETYFREEVYPVLTPLAIDPGHPFPHLLNISLNLIMVIKDHVTGEERVALMQVPSVLPRLVELPTYKKGKHFTLLGEIIAAHANALFPGLEVKESYRFRVTRDADLEIADDEASDLLKTIEEQVRRRRWGAVVRLEVDAHMPKKLLRYLIRAMHLSERDIYKIVGPINFVDFMNLTKIDKKRLKDPPFVPRIVRELRGENDIFGCIRRGDIFFHHPYDSFSSIVEFVEKAADDPRVLAIKQTLYRTNGDSSIVKALARAAENGKQVTAFVELKARFDEENNIIWARALEQAGVHVVYGIIGLKTHCKLTLVIRKEKKGLRTYVHISTGNYNEITARIYTDFGFLTASEDLAFEATALFNYLTGYSHQTEWDKITVAPVSLRQKTLALIQREAEKHKSGKPGRIIVKMNALVDAQVIRALYRASQAGVKIDLIVRGICCLKPGIPGLSENIRVRSIVGRFLEHTRVFVFNNAGDTEIFISSADWMPRNLNRRVEAMTIIEDENAKDMILNLILPMLMSDNVKSYELDSEGNYTKFDPGKSARINCQEELIKLSEAAFREPKTEEEEEF